MSALRLSNEDYSPTLLGVLVDAIRHPIWFWRGMLLSRITRIHGTIIRHNDIQLFLLGRGLDTSRRLETRLHEILVERGFNPKRVAMQRILGTLDYEAVELRWRWPWLRYIFPDRWIYANH